MKKLLFIAAIILAATNISLAQIQSASLTASGLTCSMCSKAISKSLGKIAFIQSVTPDIEGSSYSIVFKPGAQVNPDALKKAVEGAGFSVASLKITAKIPQVNIANDAHATIGGLNIHFLNVPAGNISGLQTFTIVDRGFLPVKDYNRYGRYTQMQCFKTGVMAACCAKDAGLSAGRIYHVTL